MQVLSDRILVRCEFTPETEGGIIIPDGQRKKLNRGIIMAVGNKVVCEDAVKGAHVVFNHGAGVDLDKEHQLIRESDIQLITPAE